jgi:predicted DNA-binding transcriptional regulator AlpA
MTGYEVVSFDGLSKLGISWGRTHVDREEKAGRFPKSFKLSASPSSRSGRRVWWLHEIIEWLKSKAARNI